MSGWLLTVERKYWLNIKSLSLISNSKGYSTEKTIWIINHSVIYDWISGHELNQQTPEEITVAVCLCFSWLHLLFSHLNINKRQETPEKQKAKSFLPFSDYLCTTCIPDLLLIKCLVVMVVIVTGVRFWLLSQVESSLLFSSLSALR